VCRNSFFRFFLPLRIWFHFIGNFKRTALTDPQRWPSSLQNSIKNRRIGWYRYKNLFFYNYIDFWSQRFIYKIFWVFLYFLIIFFIKIKFFKSIKLYRYYNWLIFNKKIKNKDIRQNKLAWFFVDTIFTEWPIFFYVRFRNSYIWWKNDFVKNLGRDRSKNNFAGSLK